MVQECCEHICPETSTKIKAQEDLTLIKLLKRSAIIFVGMMLLFFGAGACLPSSFEVSRESIIDRDPAYVYAIIKDLDKWKPWDPWQSKASGMTLSVTQRTPKGMEGEWLREGIREGRIKLVETTPDKRLDISIRRGNDLERKLVFELKDMGNKTRLKWTVSGANPMYPIGNLFALQMDSRIGPTYELALQSLKQYAETSSVIP